VRRARWLTVLLVVLVSAGVSQIAAAGWIHAKAIVAQHLIASAWAQARDGGTSRRPWPWADMRPIARLQVPARGIDLYVLDAASARALAFGPAHVSGTAAPGSAGNAVIVAHRDTHFAFLRDLALEDEITIEVGRGVLARYRVREVTIADKSASRLLDPADSPQLTLITCYPFDAVQPGTPMRYVVIAERVA
jgi:sortase A